MTEDDLNEAVIDLMQLKLWKDINLLMGSDPEKAICRMIKSNEYQGLF
jgi:hypothetical protein